MKILADSTLPNINTLFTLPFKLEKFSDKASLNHLIKNNNILLCRSTLKITNELLNNTNISCVASATSGTCHIDTGYLQTNNIKLFDAKGANSTSVKDYILSSLALLITKNKLKGNKIGIIGSGFVGQKTEFQLKQLNFKTVIYDPYKLPNSKINDLFECDVICICANFHEILPFPTKNLLNFNFLQKLKKNTIIINTARGGIVNEVDLLKCNDLIYCTDVFLNEPDINPQIIKIAEICTPHIAGHSIEGKLNTVKLITQKIYKHCNLLPPCASFYTDPILQLPISNWHELVLSLYNPEKETMLLKNTVDIKQTFNNLRKLHKNRNDFVLNNKDLGELCPSM